MCVFVCCVCILSTEFQGGTNSLLRVVFVIVFVYRSLRWPFPFPSKNNIVLMVYINVELYVSRLRGEFFFLQTVNRLEIIIIYFSRFQ